MNLKLVLQGIKSDLALTADERSIIENGALKKRFKYVILAPEGTKGAYIENISAFKGQYEFLLDYNCEFKLTAKNGRIIYLEVVV